ncbi:phage head-tail connector protein [Qipengyuania sp. XHP0207]|uniref:head-tail connector protein n=1 Tax=Qipengyuania sp. XHP0207 TaxID=3038078 RepID=UPI00241F28E3|nr:phage head-tail connector protein [Qipengyuania sp. XHP0207]MDG5748248.1 phage head-tail connector protein [Qipengyuania sp. XHP0207]
MRQIVTQAGFTELPLAELKTWLAISGTRDDAVLAGLIASATAMCESFTGLFPLKTGVRERLDASCEWQVLNARPFINVGTVEAIAHTGLSRLLDPGEYTCERTGDGARVRLNAAIPEPHLRISYDVGLANDWASLDSGLRHGIVRFAAHAYRERDQGGDSAIPSAVAALWRPWRRLRL